MWLFCPPFYLFTCITWNEIASCALHSKQQQKFVLRRLFVDRTSQCGHKHQTVWLIIIPTWFLPSYFFFVCDSGENVWCICLHAQMYMKIWGTAIIMDGWKFTQKIAYTLLGNFVTDGKAIYLNFIRKFPLRNTILLVALFLDCW